MAYDGGIVQMANNSASKIVGKGTVRFRMLDGKKVLLTDVRHVPGLKQNLVSLGRIDEKGCKFSAEGGTLKVLRGDKVVLQGRKLGNLYRLEGSVVTGRAAVNHKSSCQGEQGAKRSRRRTRNRRRRSRRAQGDIQAQSGGSNGVRWLQKVQKEAQSNERRSSLKSCTTQATTLTKKNVSFAEKLISDGYTSGMMHARSGEVRSRLARN
jgi:hypothetical protein